MKVVRKHNLTLASDFFFKFARFEYALKAIGYHINHRGAQADWIRLAKELERLFQNPPGKDFEEAIKYYIKYPPKKQVIKHGKLSWEDREPTTNLFADKILQYVRRVRNNLFHGGKFKGQYFENPERSEDLMRHGLVILDTCLSEKPELSEAYEG